MDNPQNLSNMSHKLLTKKNVFIVLGMVIVLEVVWALWSLMGHSVTNPPSPATVKTLTQVKPTTVSLEANKTTLKVGEQVTVSIKLSSNKKTDGTDLIITYDPKILSVQTVANQPVRVGTIYSDYPSNVLDDKLGKVTVSGITSQPGGVLADGPFGTITFVAKSVGQSKISLDFTAGKTTDSNVIEVGTGKDVLEKVQNLEVVIQ